MPNTVEFYLSKGLNLKTAQYYAAGRRRIVSVQPCAPGTLLPTNPTYDPMFYTTDEVESLPVRVIGRVVELRGKF